MPRQARIDIPGQLYHVMSRGIERKCIFKDKHDYANFVERLAYWQNKLSCRCLAWSLIPNHFHLLLLRGRCSISELMHHVLTGYAVHFNNRHNRSGHLFQNRYKAIICNEEEYFLKLLPYIHRNPLRAKLVSNLDELNNYKWCGHNSIMTGNDDKILDRGGVLSRLGANDKAAVIKYMQIIKDDNPYEQSINLSEEALRRNGTGLPKNTTKFMDREISDNRILGNAEFILSIHKFARQNLSAPLLSRTELLATVEKNTGINQEHILRPSHERGPAKARAVYCYLSKVRGGISGSELMQDLGISQSAVSRLIAKGRTIAEELKIVI